MTTGNKIFSSEFHDCEQGVISVSVSSTLWQNKNHAANPGQEKSDHRVDMSSDTQLYFDWQHASALLGSCTLIERVLTLDFVVLRLLTGDNTFSPHPTLSVDNGAAQFHGFVLHIGCCLGWDWFVCQVIVWRRKVCKIRGDNCLTWHDTIERLSRQCCDNTRDNDTVEDNDDNGTAALLLTWQ